MTTFAMWSTRVLGGIYGLLVGDALGVPYEFHAPERIPARELIEMEPPPGFGRSHAGTPPGTWSDDGALALCLVATLLACGRFDAADFGRRLVEWYRRGYMAVDGRVFDVGNQTLRAIHAIESGSKFGHEPEHMGAGNGALMRALPLALWYPRTEDSWLLVSQAMAQSAVTHPVPISGACCAIYCLWASSLLREPSRDPRKAFADAVDRFGEFAQMHVEAREEFEAFVVEYADHAQGKRPVRGTGYVVDSLLAALHVQTNSYEETVRGAIALGDDTDTTAAIAGGIAGIRFGYNGIPVRWRGLVDQRGAETVDAAVIEFVRRCAKQQLGAP